jgi:hypothetical protein
VTLRRHIVRSFDVDPALLDGAIRDSLDTVANEHTRQRASGSPTERIADRLADTHGEDPSLMLDLLRAGEIGLFEAMFSRITGLKPMVARRTIYEPGGKTLAVACRASAIDKSIFAAIFLLTRQARHADKPANPKELPTALAFFDAVEPETARRTLESLRFAAERSGDA